MRPRKHGPRIDGTAMSSYPSTSGFGTMDASSRRLDRSGWSKSVAVLTLSFLMLGGLLAAGHFHSIPRHEFSVPASGDHVSDGLCALCVIRLHSSTLTSQAPSVSRQPALASVLHPTPQAAPCLRFRSRLFGRAPPVSL